MQPAAPVQGAVWASSRDSHRIACSRLLPHMSVAGCSEPHTAGRSGWPNKRQRNSASSCTQATPAGLPCGMPGIGVLIDGAMQHAAQPDRQAGASVVVSGGDGAAVTGSIIVDPGASH